MNARLLFVHALSPLHAGTGQGVGVIDLPVAREQVTGLPYLPGSSVKGTLRDADGLDPATRHAIFGPETENAADFAGAAQFADQRLLLLPVRSLAGAFAWVTSPYVVRRFARDAREAAGLAVPPTAVELTATEEAEPCLVGADSTLEVCIPIPPRDGTRAARPVGGDAAAGVSRQKRVVLEDLDLTPRREGVVDEWAGWLGERLFPAEPDAEAWRTALRQRLCVVRDEVLGFLVSTALEVTARVRLLPEAKTVAAGALWYEEALPAETVLAGLVAVVPVTAEGRKPLAPPAVLAELARLVERPMQFGGKATVGRGLCRVRLEAGDGDPNA